MIQAADPILGADLLLNPDRISIFVCCQDKPAFLEQPARARRTDIDS
ncbi:MAG TPA: hypothetical protein VM123_05955 [archaeon]|nr:hypothetical protein [archaeon]